MIRPAFQLTTDGREERQDVGDTGTEQGALFTPDAFAQMPGQTALTDNELSGAPGEAERPK